MFQISLQNFEGPLDLLLFFIKRDEIDIYDIPIARITEEYLRALDSIHQVNLAVAGEFVEMAAMLMRIKAKMLLPVGGMDEDDAEDPRTELVRRLLEYQQYKEAVTELENFHKIRARKFSRSAAMNLAAPEDDTDVYLRDISLYELAAYFKNVMDRIPVVSAYELQREPVGLEDQKRFILSKFNADGVLRFSSIAVNLKDKVAAVVTFLAILELVRQSQIKLLQRGLFKDLELRLMNRESI